MIDGNTAALNAYLNRQDELDSRWNSIVGEYDKSIKDVVLKFQEAMDDFIELKESIGSELVENGMADDDDVIMDLMCESGDSDILSQMNEIDW